MTESYEALMEDESAVNTAYNMIKYADRWDKQTMIFVFDEADKCRYCKHMCDYSMLREMTEKMRTEHSEINDTAWHYQAGEEKYIIRMKKEAWYFVLDTRKEEE